MGLHLESMVGVARWSHSSTLKIASQVQVYVMKPYQGRQTCLYPDAGPRL